MNKQPILEVTSVARNFGGIVAVRDVSFELAAGEICRETAIPQAAQVRAPEEHLRQHRQEH